MVICFIGILLFIIWSLIIWKSVSSKRIINIELHNVFDPCPSFNSRGDKEFYFELKDYFKDFDFNCSNKFFEEVLYAKYNSLIEKGVEKGEDVIYFKHYNQHGISAGCININDWNNKLLPLILKRHLAKTQVQNID